MVGRRCVPLSIYIYIYIYSPPCLQAQLGVLFEKPSVFPSSSSFTGVPLNYQALSDTLTYHALSDTLTESERDEISLSWGRLPEVPEMTLCSMIFATCSVIFAQS